jgi:hypothetical protein
MRMADLYGNQPVYQDAPPVETVPAIDEATRLELADAIVSAGIVPPEMAPLVTQMLLMVDPAVLSAIVNDAREAKALMDAGRTEEARAMIEQHREAATAHGLGAIFDSIAAGIE